MNDYSEKDKYDFKIDESEEWVLVHSGAVTNTNPEGAGRNADNIACYIAHFDDISEFQKKNIW